MKNLQALVGQQVNRIYCSDGEIFNCTIEEICCYEGTILLSVKDAKDSFIVNFRNVIWIRK